MDLVSQLLLLQAAVAVAGPAILLIRRSRLDLFHPLIAFGVPYFAITTGPVLRYVAYGTLPYGVSAGMLERTMLVPLGAQAGILLGWLAGRVVGLRPSSFLRTRRPARLRTLALAFYAVAIAGAAVALGARWLDLASLGKFDLDASGSIWARLHYASFFALLAVIPAIVVTDQMVAGRWLPRRTRLAVALFGLVCLLEGERDVVLVLLMVPLSWAAVRRHIAGAARPRTRRRWRSLLAASGLLAVLSVLLVGMQWARSGDGLSPGRQLATLFEKARQESVLQAALGLGSNFFITARVMDWVPQELPHEHGRTYVHTLLNLTPSFLLPQMRSESLLAWFKRRYAPTSQSGYGFGMEAEAYLNFGMGGAPVVFALWFLLLYRLYQGARQPFGAVLYIYGYTFFLPFSLYCIRGDSLMCVKGLVYSLVLMWVGVRACGPRRMVRRTA